MLIPHKAHPLHRRGVGEPRRALAPAQRHDGQQVQAHQRHRADEAHGQAARHATVQPVEKEDFDQDVRGCSQVDDDREAAHVLQAVHLMQTRVGRGWAWGGYIHGN